MEVILVGGSAIEIYTDGEYVSEDVDMVGERASLARSLEGWGFIKEGRLWSRRDLELWVDAVGGSYSGNREKLRTFSTPFGRVQLASVEDLIAKRLIEVRVWPGTAQGLFEQAAMLAAEYPEGLDWDQIRSVAKREGAEPLVEELLKRLKPS